MEYNTSIVLGWLMREITSVCLQYYKYNTFQLNHFVLTQPDSFNHHYQRHYNRDTIFDLYKHHNLKIPYGKASQVLQDDGKIVFQCQHGDLECFGNKIQACGFDALNASQQEQINFLTCIQKSRKRQQDDFENEIRQCLPDLWEGVLECAKGTEGIKLLWANGEETLNLDPKLTYVPWVTVNGKFDSKAHEQIERNIVKWACYNSFSIEQFDQSQFHLINIKRLI